MARSPAQALTQSPRPDPRPPGFWQRGVPDATRLVTEANLGGSTGFAVRDVASGRLLEGRDSTLPLPPASVAKATTALYALSALGPSHRFVTRLLATGSVSNGRVNGDLIMVGGGDPILDTAALDRLARDLRAAGINEVTGKLRAFAGALPDIHSIDPEQPDHLGYSPAISGLNLNFNRVYFEWRRRGGDYAISMDARAGSLRPLVRMSSMSVQPRDTPIYTYEQQGDRDQWTVARGALGTEGGRWLPVRNPAGYAVDVFATLARAQGVAVSAGPVITRLPPGARELVRHQSVELPRILNGMLRYSTNITAECVGLAASLANGGAPESLSASGARMSAWMQGQIGDARNLRYVDHSGLGDRSRVSAADMTSLLADPVRYAALSPILKPYILRDSRRRALPIQPVDVVAKTGTLNFVSALAGYIEAPSGRLLAFAISSADVERRKALSRAERERPPGGRSWARRARFLQNELVLRWGRLYGA